MSIIIRLRDKILYDLLGHVPRNRAFVFGIGLSKTATTSLTDALNILGYNARHLPPITSVAPTGDIVADVPWWVWRFDALTDLTVAAVHKELHAEFPNARFIYTRRDMARWLKSCESHFTAELSQRRLNQGQPHLVALVKAFYGSPVFDADLFQAAFERHEADVLAVHSGSRNFLACDLTAADDWKPICDFLDLPAPDLPFPHLNHRGLVAGR